MRFLPVFLDLRSGPVLLVGSGELARAKLRLLLAAGASVRWHATDGDYDVSGLDVDAVARVEQAAGDRKSTRLNSSHSELSRMPSSA